MIHWVAAAGDPRLDTYRHVGDHDWLRQNDLFVAEGRLVVDRLLALDRFDIQSVLVNRAAHDAMLERLSSVQADVYVCDDATLAGITGFNFHRGCLAVAARPAPTDVDALPDGLLLAVDGVGNPDNVGGLFRTAAAFGVDGVLLGTTSGDPLYRKAVRTSMGAVLRVPFARTAEWLPDLERFRERGYSLVALTPHPGATPLAQFVAGQGAGPRTLLMVGAEGPGLDRSTLHAADARVRIPIDSTVDSLNVVVAAAIALERLSSARRTARLS